MFTTDKKSLGRDTKVQFFRGSSGPGGQNVNKVASAVRVRHIPSGIVIVVKGQRSQSQNRKIAFERLRERLEMLNKPRKKRRISLTPPSRAREKRLQQKHARSRIKKQRSRPLFEESIPFRCHFRLLNTRILHSSCVFINSRLLAELNSARSLSFGLIYCLCLPRKSMLHYSL